jgi:hypothetical protein
MISYCIIFKFEYNYDFFIINKYQLLNEQDDVQYNEKNSCKNVGKK